MVEAIIFDWGGVLIDDPTPGRVTYCAKFLGVSEEEFKAAQNEFLPEFQRGTISEEKFLKCICQELSIATLANPSLWGEAFRHVYSPKVDMFALASDLRGHGYKIGLLSNVEEPGVTYFHEQRYTMFDSVVFSCVEGIRKPERKIYEIALKRLNVSPPNAVFIDDIEEYVKGARHVGINTILFRDSGQVRKALADSLVGVT